MSGLMQIGGRLADIGGGLASYDTVTAPPSADNTMALTNVSGSTVTNQPFAFARVFMEGEIADSPAVLIDGTPVTTGADVKTRWGDGSVKHAAIAVVASSLTNSVAKELTFQNDASPNNTAITKASMLADYDFDAVISMTVGGVTHTASARTMLTNDDYTVWRSNPVATEIILCDHSAGAAYDLVWSGAIPMRPIFHATFWSATNQVRVRYIGEISNSEALGDISVGTLTLTIGSASPSTVYTKSSWTMYLGKRWTKEYWIGGTPATAVNLNHNLTYLKETGAFPNFDTTIVPGETEIDYWDTNWQAKSKDIGDAGWWTIAMGQAGGRPEIGPIPTWYVMWLYTGDHRMRDMSLKQADLALNWPAHFREADTGKRLLRTDAPGNSGFGLPISITDRKTTNLVVGYSYGNAGDKLNVTGTNGSSGWFFEVHHVPDAFTTPYALTGDYLYIEQAQMWACTAVHCTSGDGTTVHYGRGPTGAEGGLNFGEPRGAAWMLRGRATAAFWTPDAEPMKEYLTTLTEDGIAHWEGRFNVTGSIYEGNTMWNWAESFDFPYRPNALHFIEKNAGIHLENTATGGAQCPWMVHYGTITLGWMKDMGFETDTLLAWMGVYTIGMFTDPDFNPYMASDYEQPTGQLPRDPLDTTFYQTWQDVYDDSVSINQSKTTLVSFDEDIEIDHDYGFIATCATAYLTNLTGGATARAFTETHAYDIVGDSAKKLSPKWCILPRT